MISRGRNMPMGFANTPIKQFLSTSVVLFVIYDSLIKSIIGTNSFVIKQKNLS